MRGILIVAVVAFAASALPATQAEVPQPLLILLHDVQDDGYTYVGNPVHFGYVMLEPDGSGGYKTTTHEQGKIRVVQNGVTLYQTSDDGNAAHDYDALNTFEIAFPVPGPYEVHAEIPGAAQLMAMFSGMVYPVQDAVQANLDVKAPNTAVVGSPVTFQYVLRDETGAVLTHTDALFEVRRDADNFLLFRTHTHTHDQAMQLQYAFAQSGKYKVRLTGYNAFPDRAAPLFDPVTKVLSITIKEPDPLDESTLNVPRDVNPPPMPAAKGEAPYQLLTTVDPQKESSPFSQFRLSALVYNQETQKLQPHVNFVAQVVDALGRVLYRSETLHEYDGDYDLVLNWPIPGTYTLQVAAQQGDWTARSDLAFVVAPVAEQVPFSAGPILFSADGLKDLKSGAPQRIVFHARTLAGAAAQHAEIEFQVVPTGLDQPTYLTNKIHTHATADFQVDVTFPTAGNYVLLVDGETIHGETTPAYYWEKVGGLLQVPLSVSEGTPLPISLPPDLNAPALDGNAAKAPALPLLAALSALGAALVLVRRR